MVCFQFLLHPKSHGCGSPGSELTITRADEEGLSVSAERSVEVVGLCVLLSSRTRTLNRYVRVYHQLQFHILSYLVVERFICRDIMKYIIDMGPNIKEGTFIKGTLKMVS